MFDGSGKADRAGEVAIAAKNVVKVYGALRKRLSAKWHLLRNCTLNVDGELYFVQLIILHRDYGIGLIDFREEAYAFPEFAIRLTRSALDERGLKERFPGFLPIVFIVARTVDERNLAARIAEAFSSEPTVSIARPEWADWAFDMLKTHAEDWRQGASTDPSGEEDEEPADVPLPKRRRFLIGAAGLATFLAGAGWLGTLARDGAWRATEASHAAIAATPLRPSGDEDVRLINESAAAKYLGLDLSTFRKRRDALRQAGFPEPVSVTGNYDKQAIDRWIQLAGRASAEPRRNVSAKQHELQPPQ